MFIFQDPPFVWIKKTENGTKIYSGFLIDILKEMQKEMKFSYEIHEVEDDEYGSFVGGKWIGMVGDVFYDVRLQSSVPITICTGYFEIQPTTCAYVLIFPCAYCP